MKISYLASHLEKAYNFQFLRRCIFKEGNKGIFPSLSMEESSTILWQPKEIILWDCPGQGFEVSHVSE